MTGAINLALNDSNEPSISSPIDRIANHSSMGISMQTIARPMSPSRRNPSEVIRVFKVEVME